MSRKILRSVFMPVIAAFGLAACEKVPDTSKIEKDGFRYMLGVGKSQGKEGAVYLESYASPSSTVYFFEQGGYEAVKVTSYPPVLDIVRRSTTLIEKFKASNTDADYKAKLAIGCALAQKIKSAPATGDARVEGDRPKGMRFSQAHCE